MDARRSEILERTNRVSVQADTEFVIEKSDPLGRIRNLNKLTSESLGHLEPPFYFGFVKEQKTGLP